MSEKSLEAQFNRELEDYILGKSHQNIVQTISSEEYEEVLGIGKALWDEDVCRNINEDKLRSRFMKQLEEERENKKMKKGKSLKKVMVAASVAAVLGVGMTQTAFGQNIIDNVIARFTTGHVTVEQYNPSDREAELKAIAKKAKNEPMPEEYKGKIFDKDGNEFTYFPMFMEGAYNAKGEPILCVKDGEVYTEEEWNKKYEEEVGDYTKITDLAKISDYTCFEVEMPTYLPDGITFKNAGVWSKETETENPIIEMYFVNESGKEAIYMQQRLACEEAAFETGSMSEVEEVDINGAKGLAYDNAINWETEEVIYSLMSLDQNITRDEMLKVARSFNQVSK